MGTRRRVARLRADARFRSLLRDSGVLYIGGAISVALTIVQQISTAGWLGAAGYGRFATVVAVGSLAFLLLDVRTWELATKAMARPIADGDHREVARTAWYLTRLEVLLGVVGGLVLLVAAGPIAEHLLHDRSFDGLVRAYALAIPARMVANGAMTALVRLYGRFRALTVKSVAYASARLVLLSGAAALGFGVRGVVLAMVVAEVANAVIVIGMAGAAWHGSGAGETWFDLAAPTSRQEMIRLMPSYWLSASLKALQLETLVPITAAFVAPAAVGALRLGLDIADTTSKATAPLTLVLFPGIVSAFERDARHEALQLMRRGTALIGALVIPIWLIVATIAPSLYPRLLDNGYHDLAIIATVLTTGFTANALALTIRPALVSLGAVGRQNAAGAALVAVSLGALVLAAREVGVVGSAFVMAGFLVTYTTVSWAILRRCLVERPALLAPTLAHG